MQTKFKRHQKVKLLTNPLPDDTEPHQDPPVQITSGMKGEVNLILQNGQYHIKVLSDDKKEILAYVAMDEENLEAI